MTSSPQPAHTFCEVHILKVATGETRVHEYDEWMGGEHTPLWIWSDGNYSCDCNRHLFFERAGGGEPEVGEMPCNVSAAARKYRVTKIVEVGKDEVLYAD